YRAALADADFRGQFRLRDTEERLLAADPGLDEPSPTARLDSFFVSEHELKFTEYNAETPAGAGYNDLLCDIFYGLPVLQAFTNKYHFLPIPARRPVLHALVESYRRWRGRRGEPPRIAILDWSEVPTTSEFRIFERYFGERGIECRIVDP